MLKKGMLSTKLVAYAWVFPGISLNLRYWGILVKFFSINFCRPPQGDCF